MQVKLLRAIQEKSVRPIGESKEYPVNIRLLCATHKNLADEVTAGHFRQDLYYRINVIEARVPALRSRRDDIPELIDHLVAKLCAQWERPVPSLTDGARNALVSYDYPGNVRELENILERALTLSEGGRIEIQHLQLPATPLAERESFALSGQRPPDMPLEEYLQEIERQEILTALESTHWNRTAAAKKLGLTFRSLRYRLQKLSLDAGDEKEEGTE
jgi:two-component system response regulator PilR (NtrC family)